MGKRFNKPFYLYSWDGGEDHVVVPARKGYDTPELTQTHQDQTAWLVSGIVNYNRTFGPHTVGATAGIEAEDKQEDYLQAFRKYFLSDAIDEMDLGGMSELTNAGNSWEEARMNYFGRFSYNYMEKYLVEFVWRVDGSYRFPKDKRYGFFPGVSVAWRASEETFWKENIGHAINYFKLRGSVSQTGNDALLDSESRYDRSVQYLNTYGLVKNSSNVVQYYVFGTSENSMLYPTRTPNPAITWEVGTTYNLGLDFKFLNERLSWESDIFYHKRTHMLITRNASLPEIAGITLPRENLGEMSNSGFESMIGWSDRIGKVNYNVSLNGTYTKNKILFWDEPPGAPEWQLSTGHPVATNLYYVADGVFNDQAEIDSYPHWNGAVPGDIKFVDVDGNDKIDADDRVRRMKNNEPRFVGGLNFNLSWNNWDLTALFQTAMGAEIYIQTWSGTVGNFLKDYYDKRWTPENPTVEHPRVYERENQYWITNRSTYFLRSGDYLRLKNLEIGYNFNLPGLKNAGISNLRLYTNASNIFTLDKLKVADPEADSKDLTSYPQRRIVNFGVSVTF
jgi:TonB-linked SusC/RagA family outer membrane protein